MNTKLEFEPECSICNGERTNSGQPCVCTLGSQVHPNMALPSIPVRRAATETPDPLDMPLPCDIKIGAGTIHKGCPLRTLVLRAEGLHRMLMEHMPIPTAEQRAAFQALLTRGPEAQEGRAPEGELTTVDCPVCNGKGGFEQSQCGEGCCVVGVMCDECSGQGKVIVSRHDLAAEQGDSRKGGEE